MLPYKKNMQLALLEYFVCLVLHMIYGWYQLGMEMALFLSLGFIPFLFSCLIFAGNKKPLSAIRCYYISVVVSCCFVGYHLKTISMLVFVFMVIAVPISMFIIPQLQIEYIVVTSFILLLIPVLSSKSIIYTIPISLYMLYLAVYAIGNISLLMLVKGTETYRKVMEEKTEEAARAVEVKSNFLANMSHEIRTPMNAIIGMAEMAIRGNMPKEEKEYLYQIRASGNSLLSIINDILDFSKIESGKLELVEAEYEIMSLVNDVANILNARIGKKNLELILEVDPNIPHKLCGDDLRIKQVILNLGGNAVKFTREGAVTLRINYYRTPEGIDLYVSVKDTGIGIKKEDMEKLFDSFQQLDTKKNRKMEGSGLGLTISKQMIELMGGELMVESEYEKGSEFHFMIPQKVVDDTPSTSLKEERQLKVLGFFYNSYVKSAFYNLMMQMGIAYKECNRIEQLINLLPNQYDYVFVEQECFSEMVQNVLEHTRETECILVSNLQHMAEENTWFKVVKKPLYCLTVAAVFNHEEIEKNLYHNKEFVNQFVAPRARVLIVDDNMINLKVTKGLLEPYHMMIDMCTNGWDAIKLVSANRYDLIFMDHMMPEMDGIEATHKIRELEGEYYKKIPIIAFTANAISGVEEFFIKEGLNDFLAKPLELSSVSQKLRKWLPKEKILLLEEAEAMEEEYEEEKKQDWDLGILEIDSRTAIEMMGDKELYLETLSDYYDTIEEKYEKLKRYEEEECLKEYTIEVHGLKGISRMIGAVKLADMAEQLEKQGKLGDMAAIHKHNPELLAYYKGLKEVLKPFKKSD